MGLSEKREYLVRVILMMMMMMMMMMMEEEEEHDRQVPLQLCYLSPQPAHIL